MDLSTLIGNKPLLEQLSAEYAALKQRSAAQPPLALLLPAPPLQQWTMRTGSASASGAQPPMLEPAETTRAAKMKRTDAATAAAAAI